MYPFSSALPWKVLHFQSSSEILIHIVIILLILIRSVDQIWTSFAEFLPRAGSMFRCSPHLFCPFDTTKVLEVHDVQPC